MNVEQKAGMMTAIVIPACVDSNLERKSAKDEATQHSASYANPFQKLK